jgi:hypothetical protein
MPLADDQNHGPGTHAEALQSGVQRMGSATATSVIWVGHESPSLEFDAERPARGRDHCRAPNRREAPRSTGMPLPSVSQPLRRRIAGDRKPQQLLPSMAHKKKGKQPLEGQGWNHAQIDRRNGVRMGCAGMAARSAMAVHGARSCTSKLLTPRLRIRASAARRGSAERSHNGFSLLIRRMRSRSSCSILRPLADLGISSASRS